jgi:hypothetical protein
MSQSMEGQVPPGVERYGWVLGADGEHGGIDCRPDGGLIRVSDLPTILTARDAETRERLEEMRNLLAEALAAEKSAVKCGEVGAFNDDQRARIQAALDAALPRTTKEEGDQHGR